MSSGLGPIVTASMERAPWGWALLATVILAMVKGWPALKKIAADREKDLATTLTERVTTLERLREEDRATWDAERQRLEDKIEAQRQLYEAKLEAQRLRNEAEVSKMRHRANNADQCLDSFVMLLAAEDDLPAKARRALEAIAQMRERQRAEQATENAAMISAKVSAGASGTTSAMPEKGD